MADLCGFRGTLSGEACRHPVNQETQLCAAGHVVDRSRWPVPPAGEGAIAPAAGEIELEDILVAGEDHQASGAFDAGELRRQLEAGLGPEAMPLLDTLSDRFAENGHSLYLVGGPVRDVLLGRPASDLDCTTDAGPKEIVELLGPWADDVWTQGAAFGTVALLKDGTKIEVTTHRDEVYVPESRKPSVAFGVSIDDDLARRDFTVNAMAVDLRSLELHDPFGGRMDLAAGVLRTPDDPVVTFSEDPLRMLRAARFAAQLGFRPAGEVEAAMRSERRRIGIVSVERVEAELSKLLVAPKAPDGLRLLVRTRLADEFLPELSALEAVHQNAQHHDRDVLEHTMSVVEAIGPTLRLRLAALFHDVGKPRTKQGSEAAPTFYGHEVVSEELARERLRRLRFPGHVVDDVGKLVGLHMRATGTSRWSERAIRRYCRDAGDLIEDLHALMEADRRAHAPGYVPQLVGELDDLKRRISELSRKEPVVEFRPELDGQRVMEILDVRPGPVVGEAMRELTELRLDRGLVGRAEAERHLRAWWARRQPPA